MLIKLLFVGEVMKHVSTTVQLKQDLLKNYDRYSRPVIDSETTMPISIGLITDLIQLVSSYITLKEDIILVILKTLNLLFKTI